MSCYRVYRTAAGSSSVCIGCEASAPAPAPAPSPPTPVAVYSQAPAFCENGTSCHALDRGAVVVSIMPRDAELKTYTVRVQTGEKGVEKFPAYNVFEGTLQYDENARGGSPKGLVLLTCKDDSQPTTCMGVPPLLGSVYNNTAKFQLDQDSSLFRVTRDLELLPQNARAGVFAPVQGIAPAGRCFA